jgi:ribonuclease HII
MGICGIDEAGRGPIAGPLVMAGVVLKEEIEGLRDSKKLTEKKREALFDEIIQKSDYKIVEVTNKIIDEKGLSFAINYCLNTIVNSLKAEKYIFDGNSKFGVDILETMIKADEKIEEVKWMIQNGLDIGVDEFCLADTILAKMKNASSKDCICLS